MPGSPRRPARIWLLAVLVVPVVLTALLVAFKGDGLSNATADEAGTAQPPAPTTTTPPSASTTVVPPQPTAAPFSVAWTEDTGLSVTASLQDQAARDKVVDEIQSLLDTNETFGDQLTVDAATGLANPNALVGLLQALRAATGDVAVRYDGTTITLTGDVADQATKATAARAAAKAVPGAVVANQLRVPTAVKPPVSEACQTFESRLAQLTGQHKILFLSGTAIVSERSRGSVERVAALLKSCATARIEVAGHTDNLGDPSTSLPLSQRRADAVTAQLVRLGVPAGRIISRGYGESEPVASNRTSAGRIANRRVEIRVP
ncbi:flagellar motor protein MotB [Kribbella sp. ALI-6-A]|uniref:channel-forming protein ArfA/OmpATb n=1 Tax=Kribbella sp. ALI-6-A TaxID=1933817 RepID=UPI00097BEDEE|nr:OmpA family protein [Kribbella sp. ALI-6-A]ONI72405.1 flagellar motor protein MotB [Kribbella sp. ALI-6-A]